MLLPDFISELQRFLHAAVTIVTEQTEQGDKVQAPRSSRPKGVIEQDIHFLDALKTGAGMVQSGAQCLQEKNLQCSY